MTMVRITTGRGQPLVAGPDSVRIRLFTNWGTSTAPGNDSFIPRGKRFDCPPSRRMNPVFDIYKCNERYGEYEIEHVEEHIDELGRVHRTEYRRITEVETWNDPYGEVKVRRDKGIRKVYWNYYPDYDDY